MEDVIRKIYSDDWSYKNKYMLSFIGGDYPFDTEQDAIAAFQMLMKCHGITGDPEEIKAAIKSCGNYVIRDEVHPMGLYRIR